MTRIMIAVALTCLSTAVFARPFPKMTPELLARTGGYYSVPGSMKGQICIADCNSGANGAWLREVAEYLRGETELNVVCTNGATFICPQPAVIGDMTVFVVDDKSMPSILVASEDCWAVVNIARLKDPRVQFFAMRVKKELVRAFALLCGGAASNYQGGLSGPMTSMKDLDKVVDYRLQVDVRERCVKYARSFGITPQITTTYLAACSHGVAPAPTNDYQKAIWDKVHAPPANPMKIEFDPKKGR